MHQRSECLVRTVNPPRDHPPAASRQPPSLTSTRAPTWGLLHYHPGGEGGVRGGGGAIERYSHSCRYYISFFYYTRPQGRLSGLPYRVYCIYICIHRKPR